MAAQATAVVGVALQLDAPSLNEPLLAFLAIVCPLLCYGYRRWRRRRRIQRIWQRHIADNSGSLNSDTARLNQGFLDGSVA